ncbi:MAG TPA: 3-oxoacyl-[acyl-carrier-protein] synthase III C-terminal domain-containing protein [Polyangium sp.]|nr:3-oxoacyl-[acyl-carrier-protein] synthase III C-terminal domain-containing protein [Polyangium sp.]
MTTSAGMRSLAITFPGGLKTNDYWRRHYPQMLGAAVEKRNVWAAPEEPREEPDAFDAEMAKYLDDPFRGARERRVLLPHENALSIETRAATMALEAAGIARAEVDLVIACSLFHDMMGIGHATFLAGELGLRSAAWNLETACSGAFALFETACALVRAGQYRNVLGVVSCTYSRSIEEHDTMSWFSGDGAGAFVVSEVPAGEGLVASAMLHSAETCKAFLLDVVDDPKRGKQVVRLRSDRSASKVLRQVSEPYLRKTADMALEKAGLRMSDIDWLVVNTPTAWYASFCARVLDFDRARTIDTFPRYANCGPALMPVNLYTAAAELPIRRGDLVLLHTVGSASSSGSAIVRWGDVALGPSPGLPLEVL